MKRRKVPRTLATTRAIAVAVGLFITLPWLGPGNIAEFSFITAARAQPAALTQAQSDAIAAYDKAVDDFKSILAQRRAQIDAKQKLPNLPGQALYLARLKVMSTYKDLTDALPSRIGRPNKFGVPPAYFEAEIEPLIEEYAALFGIMQAPPPGAQNSDTPFKDVVDLGTAIARAKGLDATTADAAGRISLGHLLCRDERQPEHRQRALQHLQGQPADGHVRRPEGPEEVGGDQEAGRGP